MDIFYNTKDLTLEQKKQLLIDAKEVCMDWNTDILDVSKSWARKRTDMAFEDTIKKLDDSCHYVIIHRDYSFSNSEDVGEIAFSTLGAGVDYFLFIHLTIDNLNKIVKKYKLNEKT